MELRLGLHAELIGQLTALVEQHPLRERLTGQLMTALTRAGRTADALAVYRRLRDALDDELGLPPASSSNACTTTCCNHPPNHPPPRRRRRVRRGRGRCPGTSRTTPAATTSSPT
ncbi:hypothetical protein GCM10027610_046440 [Dactylosporangium cerinum]